MKMYRLLPAILLLAIMGQPVFSQNLVLGASSGVGSYSMADLKSLNDAIKPSFDCQLVSDFPPYLYYQLSFFLDEEEYSFGLFYTFQSTGSRISARDYSGEYYLDMQVQSNNVGFYAAMNLLQKSKCQLSVYAKPGIAFSNLDIREHFTLLDTVLVDGNAGFRATSFFLEPGIGFSYRVIPSLGIGINAGYFLQVGGQNFHLPGEKDYVLGIPDTGKEVKPNWSGYRVGISLIYNIKQKDQEKNKIP